MNLYDSKSSYMQFSASDRLIQILDFGEVSTDRQVLSRVTRKVLSNSNITCYRQIPRFLKSSQSLKPRCLLGVRKRG